MDCHTEQHLLTNPVNTRRLRMTQTANATVLPNEFDAYKLGEYDRSAGVRYIQLELTTRCNLRCPSCIHGQTGIAADNLDHNTFIALINTVPSLRHVSFVGMGETLLSPHLTEYISLCSERGIRTAITTNGTVSLTRLEAVLKSGLNKLTISIDGHNDETFSYARGGAQLAKVLTFASEAVRVATTTGGEVWGGITLTKYNVEYLSDIVATIGGSGISNIYIESIHHWGSDFSLNDLSVFSLPVQHVTKQIEKALGVAGKAQLNVKVFDYKRIFDEGISMPRMCGWPIDACVVRANGTIAPCCIQLQGEDRVSFGDLAKESLPEIWLSDSYKRFASSFCQRKEPEYCRKCIYRAEFGKPTGEDL